jgi:hypothetical protein
MCAMGKKVACVSSARESFFLTKISSCLWINRSDCLNSFASDFDSIAIQNSSIDLIVLSILPKTTQCIYLNL